MRSPARRSLCWVKASLALRSTVSARARLSPRCGTRTCTREPRSPHEPLGQRVDVRRQLGHEDLARHGLARVVRGLRERRLFAVELREEPLDQRGRLGRLDLVDHPAALAADPAPAHVEDLDRRLQLVLGEGDDVGVRAVAEHDGLASPSPGAARRGRRAAGRPARTPAPRRRSPCAVPARASSGPCGRRGTRRSRRRCRGARPRSPGRRRARSTCRCSRAGRAARSDRAGGRRRRCRCGRGRPGAGGRASRGSPRHGRTDRSSARPCAAGPR